MLPCFLQYEFRMVKFMQPLWALNTGNIWRLLQSGMRRRAGMETKNGVNGSRKRPLSSGGEAKK